VAVSRRAFVVAERVRGRRASVVGMMRAYRGRASGVMVGSSLRKPQAPGAPVAEHGARRGRLRPVVVL